MKLAAIVTTLVMASNLIGSENETDIAKNLKVFIAEPIDAYVLDMVRPSYPFEMRAKGVSGQVLVRAIISAEGVPVHVEVISTTLDSFGDSAVKAIRQWYFEPARVDGISVAQSIVIPVRFELDEELG